ncbi:uncharacterized protein PGTG_04564 [Puccinia graminis f. sp. tritici CRL 75-36-700-3]|uniref:AAA+ ATPase domain-containing protein n=1 Tax=Puccinia graminis f. sp. tritici (strain CRL 75-36-700-3 / race SCCL) TaxID=418459 RepID=E3K2N9_PUCGT|nr:uncharacterized protein PGTG_04564 [Puccinia graminis f. sp. tritici CRL 75-36-700-3]EFP78608.2 hypothetical protein PGTG_04564 [Puccinia graminis f. sp. tritici CRL 75-36-700-3]
MHPRTISHLIRRSTRTTHHHHHHHYYYHYYSTQSPKTTTTINNNNNNNNNPISRPPAQATQPYPEHHHQHQTIKPPTINGGPIDLYQERIKAGLLNYDPFQVSILNQLQELYQTLADYHPQSSSSSSSNQHHQSSSSSSWFRSLFSQSTHSDNFNNVSLEPTSDLPSGIYLYGSVGTGKSMLMDSFYESLKNLPNQASLPAKRIHFHQFMVDIHKRNHKLQSELHRDGQLGQADVLITIAREIAQECKVLCFDEFQVTDIVDAMILKRLLEGLLHYGVVTIMTSNRHPDELYKNGIQRESFLGCIELIKRRTRVIDLNSGTDYRKQLGSSGGGLSTVFLSPISAENRAEFAKRFDALTDHEPILENRLLPIWGTRHIPVPLSTSSVAWFDFNQLCAFPLSAADYLQIVSKFNVLFINNVPKLSSSQRDFARRFILFLDAAYESKTKLFTLSEVPIAQIFSGESSSSEAMTAEMRAAMDDLGLDSKTIGASSLFSGEEETFAWARAVSRLNEMGSLQWSLSSSPSSSSSDQSTRPKPFAHPGHPHAPAPVGASDLVSVVQDGDGSELLTH